MPFFEAEGECQKNRFVPLSKAINDLLQRVEVREPAND